MRRRKPHPSPSEMVMCAMFNLDRNRGVSATEIIKYAKSKYGLSNASASRIMSALKRGLKFNILYNENGMYGLNKEVCRFPSKELNHAVKSNLSLARVNDQPEVDEESPGKKPAKKKSAYLCPDCKIQVEKERAAGKEVKSSASHRNGKSPIPENPKQAEKRQKWRDFLRMGLPFRKGKA